MTRSSQPREDRFEVEGEYLVRHVTPSRGRPYVHRCRKDCYELLSHVAEEMGDEGFTVESLVEAADTPSSQVAVAIAFWKERGVVETGHPRRNYPTSDALHLDAMVEYYALLEGSSGSRSE